MSQIITKVVAAAGLVLAAGGAWAAEKGGGHKFPPLQAETYASQIFWLTIIFAALYLLMATDCAAARRQNPAGPPAAH